MPKNHRALQSIWRWLGAFAAAISAVAGTADRSGAPFIVDTWGIEEGLPQSSVISAIQTRDGYLWVGTLNGLVRFDGIHFSVFDQHNTPGLNSDRIVYLFEDSRTNLWIGTDTAGVALARNGEVRSVDAMRAGHEGRLVSACEDATGTVWLYAADARLGRYQNGKMDALNLPFNSPAVCRRIIAEKSGLLWVGEDRGMLAIDPSNFKPPTFPIQQAVPADKLDFILAGRQGGTWRLINGRVQKWDGVRLEKDLGPFPWTNVVVTSACEDKDGNLIVGTLGAGVFWYDADGRNQQVSMEQGLSSESVLCLCLDGAGNLWVGTDGGGLNRIKRSAFSLVKESHERVVQSVSEDARGGLWMAFNAQGTLYWSTNRADRFAVGQYSNAWTVLVDGRQQVWVGTRGEGLFRLQAGQLLPAPGAEILGGQIFVLFEDRNGQLWVGTQNGLARWDGQAWTNYTARDGLSENIIRAVAEDAAGNLWIGTESRGLNLFKGGVFTFHPVGENGPPGNDVSCLHADKDGVLWIGTSGHGLARFQSGRWTHYSTDNGLPSNCINYIIEDEMGDLWIGSNRGLTRINRLSLNQVANGTTNAISCRTYVESDGLPTRECSSGSQPAACRTRDGRLWFPTTKGLVTVNPAELKPNPQPPSVMIESVLIEGREQKTNRLSSTWEQSILVPPGREQLRIDYTALNFSTPELVRFKYWLEGHETSWTEAGDVRVAHYPKLPPRHYRFHVTASNEDGVPNQTGSILEITVQPQFWQTTWFFAAVIVVFLGMIVGGVRYVSTQNLLRQLQSLKQQEALEKERARIARDLHDQLGANLTQVALLGEMAEADKHSPGEIESHTRQISQTARETTRSLDEIVWAVNPSNDTLDGLVNYACKYAQDYLAMAELRYRVEVPTQLPAVIIPPEVRHNVFLAFKEAVNNVVKHAQASEVWIRLRLQPGNLFLEVEDNGRGVAASNANTAQTGNGLRNMRKRMEEIDGDFSILPGAHGGAVVRLRIPLAKKAA